MNENCCPICIEIIDTCNSLTTNHTITDCGHLFHTSCIMKHVSMNGFQCPYCRTYMITNDDNTLYTENDFYNTDYDNTNMNNANIDISNEISEILQENSREINEDVFRGMRFLFQRAYREPHELTDVRSEQNYMYDNSYHTESIVDTNRLLQQNKPPVAFIVRKLLEEGVTMIQMVESMLENRVEYYVDENDYFGRINDNIQEKIHNIIQSYETLVESIPIFPSIHSPLLVNRL